MSANSRIHPFITLRVPCVSLEYCLEIWRENNIIDEPKEAKLRTTISGYFVKNEPDYEVNFEYLYLPLFCKWGLIESSLKMLVQSQIPKHYLDQYSVDFMVVPNKVFTDDDFKKDDLPDSNVSKFHELSFDTVQVLSKIKTLPGMRTWVSIFPMDDVRFDPFHASGKNKHLQRLKKTFLCYGDATSSSSSGSSNNIDYNPPSQLVVVKCPSIVFNKEYIEQELCSTSVYMDFEACITNIELFSSSVIVLPKEQVEGDTDTTCMFLDVSTWVIVLYKNDGTPARSNPDGKPPEVPIFTNVWEVNKRLFVLFNSFMRDYFHFIEEREIISGSGDTSSEHKNTVQIFCKADLAADSPFFEKSVTSKLLYRASVRKNGALFLENLISDHPKKRKETGEYKMDIIKENAEFIGIGMHSFHFDMEMLQHVYYKKNTSIPFLDIDDQKQQEDITHIESLWKTACNKKGVGYAQQKRKYFSKFDHDYGNNSQQKPLFYFFFIWHYSCQLNKILSVTLVVFDNRKISSGENQYQSFSSNNSDRQQNVSNVANTYEELKQYFSSQTKLSEYYLEYLLRRLVPFILVPTDDGKLTSSKICIKVPVCLLVKRTIYGSAFTHIESYLDSALHVSGTDTTSVTKRFCKMPFWYNDVNGYFENNCKPLFDILRKEKYKLSTITGCFPLDRSLLNYGLVKYGQSDIFTDYDYNNILGQLKNLISVSLQICKICHIEMKEALFGSKMLWFTRLCEYLCLINNYPKPNKMRLVGKRYFDTGSSSSNTAIPSFLSKNSTFRKTSSEESTQSDIILDDITNKNVDMSWKVFGGDIAIPMIGHYDKKDSSIIATMDFDAFYNSIICEYELGYICYRPNADSENNKIYISNELIPTFSDLITTRRKIKEKKNKTQEEVDTLYALKRAGNSIYGCVASQICPISSEFFANFITWIGRITIRETRSIIQRHSPSYVLFSQTDGLCVRVDRRLKQHQESTTIPLLVKEINTKLCQNNFMKLVQEESFSDLHVFNKNTYVAENEPEGERRDKQCNFFYETLVESILTNLESILDYKEEYINQDSHFYSRFLIGNVLFKEYVSQVLYPQFEKDYKTKSIFTKKWPLLKKVFFIILLLCRKFCNNRLNYPTCSNVDIFGSFVLFRMKQLALRIHLQKNPLLLSTLCKFTDGIPELKFLSLEHFKNKFLDTGSPNDTSNVIGFRHLIETCNFMGDLVRTLKDRGFQIPPPWDVTIDDSQNAFDVYLKEYYDKGWTLQNPNISIEPSSTTNTILGTDNHWWKSLVFIDYVTSMNAFHMVTSEYSICCLRDYDGNNNKGSEEIAHLLRVQTVQHVSDMLDFLVLTQALYKMNLERAIKEELISINRENFTIHIPLLFKNPENSSILFVHDMTISFDPNFTKTLYKDMIKYGHAFTKLLAIKLCQINHFSASKQKPLKYYGQLSMIIITMNSGDNDNGNDDSHATIEDKMCLLLKAFCVDKQ